MLGCVGGCFLCLFLCLGGWGLGVCLGLVWGFVFCLRDGWGFLFKLGVVWVAWYVVGWLLVLIRLGFGILFCCLGCFWYSWV